MIFLCQVVSGAEPLNIYEAFLASHSCAIEITAAFIEA